jgi:Putative auto-transporter adhesin, head GIN domain
MKTCLIICLVLLGFTACKKPENRKCFKSTGEDTTLEIPLSEFNRLKLHPHVSYILIQDSTDKVVITGGKNVVNLVECKVEDELLEITNKNKCNFLRNAKRELLVEIHFTNIINIHYEGSEFLKSEGTLNLEYFTLMVRDGAGPVNLTLNSKVIDADISHGWGDYTFHGTTETARISARSNGFCDVYDLTITDSVYVASDTSGHLRVRAEGIPLYGYIKSGGDIFYKGNPSVINVTRTGSGELIKAD